MEKDYDLYFHEYPKKFANFRYFVETIRASWNGSDRFLPAVEYAHHPFAYPINSYSKCSNSVITSPTSMYPGTPITLLVLVKSAVHNYPLRSIIRKTWGYENRFSDVIIRTVFMLGQCDPNTGDTSICQRNIDEEQKLYGDLVQANFVDSYYNNTLKTLASLEWTFKHCSRVPYLLFVDDDFYVSIKNVLKFIRNFIRIQVEKEVDQDDTEADQLKAQTIHFDGRLYTGYVFPHSRPMRHLTSKWYITLADYPYGHYPPYVTGGCFVMNNQTVSDLYFASRYTKPFKFDDVYLGILAKRMDITLVHNPNIYFYELNYDPQVYRDVIASHGFKDPQQLLHVWLEQKTLGNA